MSEVVLMNYCKVLVRKIHPDAIIPNYAHPGDSGADLYSVDDTMVIEPEQRVLIHTGIQIELPVGHEAQVRSKSGLALKQGIMVLNSPGTVDEPYRGEVGVILHNTSHQPVTIEKGQKIAQMVIKPVYQALFIEAEDLSNTSRSEGGFGSTGLK